MNTESMTVQFYFRDSNFFQSNLSQSPELSLKTGVPLEQYGENGEAAFVLVSARLNIENNYSNDGNEGLMTFTRRFCCCSGWEPVQINGPCEGCCGAKTHGKQGRARSTCWWLHLDGFSAKVEPMITASSWVMPAVVLYLNYTTRCQTLSRLLTGIFKQNIQFSWHFQFYAPLQQC